jgi:hypothetical protein
MRALWARIALLVLLVGGSGLAATGASAAPPSAAPTSSTAADPTASGSSTDGALTSLGTDAVNDIRRCLSTKSTLNVYYLTDDSGSLGGPNGTDPQDLRSQILANSLSQLATLGDDVHVNWAAGFFSTNFQAATGWQALTSQGPADLTHLIQARAPHGATNWPAAIAGAQSSLAAQQAATNGCSVLVWLTDGGIDLGGRSADSATNDAINALCGSKVTSGAAPTSNGIFNELRQSGVVVIGVLLKVHPSALDAARMTFMRPLVESEGQLSTGATIHCGVTPIPSTYVHGALLEATAPNQLASVFVQLGAILGGGYEHPFNADGSFPIDPGVDHFLVTTEGSGWSLVPPAGSGLATITAAAPGAAKVSTAIGTTQIQVSTLDKTAIGKWKLVGATGPGLYLFSGLTLTLSSGNQLVAGTQSAVTGSITRRGGAPLDLSDYKYRVSLTQVPSNGGTPTPLGTATVDAATGKFTLAHTASSSDGIIDIVATMSPLRTSLNSLTLADLSTQQLITVALPNQFPRVARVPVHLSTLVGASGHAKGYITLSSPPDGSAGSVCFSRTPTVVSDSLARAKTWSWSVDVAHVLDAKKCVTLAPHTTKRVEVSAANSVAAYSTVHAEILVTFRAKSGDTIQQRVPVQFATTKPLNLGALSGVFLILLILGIVIPLGLLWLLNYSTTKLQRPRDMMRAAFPATLAPDGVVGKNVDLASSEIGLAQFKPLSPGEGGRRFPADQLGEMRARVPINPFASPWFEINPPAGTRVFAVEAGHVPTSKRSLVATGLMATFGGDIGRVWAFVVTDSELLGSGASGPINGTLFVYLANDARNAGQFTMRMSDVRVQSRIWERITKAKELIRAESHEKKTTPPVEPRRDRTPPKTPGGGDGPPQPPPRSPAGGPPPPPPRTGSYSAPSTPSRPAPSGPPSPTRPTPAPGGGSTPPSAPPPPPPRQAGGPPPPPPRPRT